MAVHTWVYCDDCEHMMVICGTCRNNTCNGGYGEILDPLTGQMVKCHDCPAAYEIYLKGEENGS